MHQKITLTYLGAVTGFLALLLLREGFHLNFLNIQFMNIVLVILIGLGNYHLSRRDGPHHRAR